MLVVFTLCVSSNKKMNINETQSKLQSIGLILMKQTAKSKFLSLTPTLTHTIHLLLQFERIGPLPNNAILLTLDVSSLDINIHQNEGIKGCRHFLNTRQSKTLRRKERTNTQYTKDRTPFLITFNPALRKIFSVLNKTP